MLIWLTLFCHGWLCCLERAFGITLSADRNPVPNPGGYVEGCIMLQPMTRQSVLHEYFFDDHAVSKGEGCHSSTTVTEALNWQEQFIQRLANSGHASPMGPGSNCPTVQRLFKSGAIDEHVSERSSMAPLDTKAEFSQKRIFLLIWCIDFGLSNSRS